MKQMTQFAFAGVIGYLVDLGVLLLMTTFVGPYLGRLVSFSMAIITTWLINRSLTFRNARSDTPIHREFLLYVLTALGGGAVNLASYAMLVNAFSQMAYVLPLAVALGSLSGMLVNFWLSKRFVFKIANSSFAIEHKRTEH